MSSQDNASLSPAPSSATKQDTANEWHPSQDGGLREAGKAFLIACLLMTPILGFGGREVYKTWRTQEDARQASLAMLEEDRLKAIKLARAHPELIAAPALPMLSIDDAARGRDLFASACVACHGSDAKGLQGLGKNLLVSGFVASQNDEELKQFLVTGRPNAKPVGMPPKAGRDDLTDEDLRHLVVYMRGLQDPRRMPTLPAMVADAPPSASQKEAALAAAGGDKELAGYIASGDKLFHSSCIACHGKGGVGIAGNGKALANNEFIRSLDDDSLLAFIKQGRSPSDPKNTTGIQMPPKGGNPAMSDDDILDVIAYLRTLQGTKPGTPGDK